MRQQTAVSGIGALAMVALLVTGCTVENPAYQPGPELPDECRAGSEVSETFEQFERPHRVDLWFIVADTGAMESYQDALAASLPPFGQAIDESELDVQAAVSTMNYSEDVGLAPVIGGPEGCEDNTEPVVSNDRDGWIDALACNIRQGTDGQRRRRPLDVARQALVEEPESLEEFRRDDARLVIVMLTNEDDCSGQDFDDDPDTSIRNLCYWQTDQLGDVHDWSDNIRQTTTVEEGISLAAISGPATDVEYEEDESVRRVCSSGLSNSYPGDRLYGATRALGDQGLFLSSCVLDFYGHLERIADRMVLRDTVTLCPSEPMAHEPLEVTGVYEDDEHRAIDFGDGFEFAGATDECPHGAIRLARRAAQALQQLEMTYCGM